MCGGALGKRVVAGSGVCAGRVVRAGLWRAGVPGWRLPFRHINPVVAGGKGVSTMYVDRMRPIAVVHRCAAAYGVTFTPPPCLHTLISRLHFVISHFSLWISKETIGDLSFGTTYHVFIIILLRFIEVVFKLPLARTHIVWP